MAETVYALCFLLSVLCAILLFKKYRTTGAKLLLWTGIAFGFIAFNNIILFVDLVLIPQTDFGGAVLRIVSGTIGSCVLLFGLIWEAN